jgi:transcriptional regulator with XRE-family HTH domain
MLPRIDEVERGDVRKPMALHEAIRSAYQGRTRQEDLADAIGVDQGTVSRWSNGKSVPNVLQQAEIERLSGRPVGWISVQAGLIDEVTTVPEAIALAPELDDTGRAAVLAAYHGVVSRYSALVVDQALDGGSPGS